MHSKSLVTSVI